MKIAIVCNDTFGVRMAGPAIRSMELASALSREHEVWLIGDANSDENVQFPVPWFDTAHTNIQAAAQTADILIVQGDALKRFPLLRSARGALVADLYCPIQLEYFVSSDTVPEITRQRTALLIADTLSEQLHIADHFLCASQRQLHFWLGAFSLTGRLSGITSKKALQFSTPELFSCVPFGVSDLSPVTDKKSLRERFNLRPDDFVLIWGGGIYDWFDAPTVIKAVAALFKDGAPVQLVFMGVKHPNPNLIEHDSIREAVELARSLGLLDSCVHFNFGWVNYDERHNYLLDADAGISAHLDNVETIYSFRTRMLDYLWCGLPIIATRGDEFGDNLEARHAGLSVEFQDVQGWISAIKRLMEDRNLHQQFSKNAINWSKELRWSIIVSDFSRKCHALKASPMRKTWLQAWNIRRGRVESSFFSRSLDAYNRLGLLGTLKRIVQKLIR